MAKTNSGLVAYAKAQVGKPYWWGTYGQTADESLYNSKKKQYPSYYTASDFKSQYGKRVHDCIGLIKGYLWSDSATATPKYNSAQDKNASGMYAAAATKGAISSFPKTAGLLVFRGTSTSKITHVGVYGGDGYVYEAKGHAYGVVKTAYKAADWNYWAQCPYCTDDTTKATTSTTTTQTTATKTTTSTASTSSKPSYTVGKTYTTQVEVNVRKGAGTSYAKVGYSGLTSDGKKHDKDKDGALDKGTTVTCKEVKSVGNDIWIRCPSGWIAAYYDGNVYAK